MSKYTKQERPAHNVGEKRSMSQVVAEHNSFYEWRYGVTPREINNGHCVDYAEELVDAGAKVGLEVTPISEDELKFGEDYATGYEAGEEDDLPEEGWNIRGIVNTFHSPLPSGVTEELLNTQLETGYHVFVECDGKFYDAECPMGVTNLFDLPFYARYLFKLTKGNQGVHSPYPETESL